MAKRPGAGTVVPNLSRVVFAFVATLGALSAPRAWGWGDRGHHAICVVATRLVQDPELREFMVSRADMLGHVCNVPDTYWRSLGAVSKSGDPTHFIDAELLPVPLSALPIGFAHLVGAKIADGKDIPNEFGSLWWRAQQFYRRAEDAGVRLKKAPPLEKKQSQDWNAPYNAAAYDFIVNAGLLGHFVGDASQPYHNTLDYDGWDSGRGGVHAYYETAAVNALPLDLETQIFRRARGSAVPGLRRKALEDLYAQEWVAARMREISEWSRTQLPRVMKADRVLKSSSVVRAVVAVAPGDKQDLKPGEKGSDQPSEKTTEKPSDADGKIAAKREPVARAAARFAPLIYEQMARSALLLAQLWDESYRDAGRPALKAYRSYRYPLQPDWVAPDYLPAAPAVATPGAPAK